MKNTSFERVERTSGGKNREEVIIHRKKRYAHWQLKLVSLVLAVLLWLILANVYEAEHREEEGAPPAQQEQSALCDLTQL